MGLLNLLNAFGVNCIIYLQTIFADSEELIDFITQIFDPLYVFVAFFPILVAVNTKLATELLAVTAFTEWLNTILKWFLREDRPYWWVQETDVYTVLTKPHLEQTALTCETGPGSPSGHVMGATAIGYILMRAANQFIQSNPKISETVKKILFYLVWLSLTFILVVVSISRMYVATHFPHQCLLGALIGLATAWALTSPSCPVSDLWRESSRPVLLLVAIVATLFTVASYWLQKALGLDPQWSVKLAFKWCENPDFIHVNTTPLYCLVRDCGTFFGLALAAPLNRPPSRMPIVPGLITAVCLGWAFDLASNEIPTGDVRLFYACHFLLAAVQPYIYLVGIPNVGKIMHRSHQA